MKQTSEVADALRRDTESKNGRQTDSHKVHYVSGTEIERLCETDRCPEGHMGDNVMADMLRRPSPALTLTIA